MIILYIFLGLLLILALAAYLKVSSHKPQSTEVAVGVSVHMPDYATVLNSELYSRSDFERWVTAMMGNTTGIIHDKQSGKYRWALGKLIAYLEDRGFSVSFADAQKIRVRENQKDNCPFVVYMTVLYPPDETGKRGVSYFFLSGLNISIKKLIITPELSIYAGTVLVGKLKGTEELYLDVVEKAIQVIASPSTNTDHEGHIATAFLMAEVKYKQPPANTESTPLMIEVLVPNPISGWSTSSVKLLSKFTTMEGIEDFYPNMVVSHGTESYLIEPSKMIKLIIAFLTEGISVFIGGEPGTGKSQLAMALCKMLKLQIPDLGVIGVNSTNFDLLLNAEVQSSYIFQDSSYNLRYEDDSPTDSNVESLISKLILFDQGEDVMHQRAGEMANIMDGSNIEAPFIIVYNGNKEEFFPALFRAQRSIHIEIGALPMDKAFKLRNDIKAKLDDRHTFDDGLFNRILAAEPIGFITLAEVFSCRKPVSISTLLEQRISE